MSRKTKGEIGLSGEDLKYADEEWSQPGADAKGHSERLSLRVPPQVLLELELLFNHFRDLTSYRSTHDIVRHAVARHIAFLHALEPTMKRTYLGALQAMQMVFVEDRQRTETEATFHDLESRVDIHLNRGDRGEAIRLMYDTKAAIVRTPDTAWKRRWLERFNQKYGPWLSPLGTAMSTNPDPKPAQSEQE